MMEWRVSADGWTIGSKAAILCFAAASALMSEWKAAVWIILYILVYISAAMSYYVFNYKWIKSGATVLSIILAAAAAVELYPTMWLLLPAHLYELAVLAAASAAAMRPPLMYSSAATPLFAAALILAVTPLVPSGQLALYLLIGALTVLYYSSVLTFLSKWKTVQEERDRLRDASEQLRTKLKGSDAVLRQAEYTLKLEERNKLSQNVHDTIGHAMTGALIQMEAAKLLIHSDPERSAELLGNAIVISKEGIDRIRADLAAIKPKTEQLGLHRLKLFLEEFSAKQPIRTALTHEGNLDAISLTHWRIIQENVKEALTNTMKYSGASSVSVRIQVLPTLIKAEVADNGRGQTKIIKGLGIAGMEERAAEVKGHVIVDGSRGFSVTTLLPYPL